MNSSTCQCSKPKYDLVFSCSGAADVGAISDRAARLLAQEKTASMCCAAAVAAGIPEILDVAKNARSILAIDGCPKVCVKIILEKAGFPDFMHLQLETLGLIKGESPATDDRIEIAVVEARNILSA